MFPKTPEWDPRNPVWDYSVQRQRFAAMASDLGLPVGAWPHVFRLKNPLTGTTATFTYSSRETDSDGDVTVMCYTMTAIATEDPTVDTDMKLTAIIFND